MPTIVVVFCLVCYFLVDYCDWWCHRVQIQTRGGARKASFVRWLKENKVRLKHYYRSQQHSVTHLVEIFNQICNTTQDTLSETK